MPIKPANALRNVVSGLRGERFVKISGFRVERARTHRELVLIGAGLGSVLSEIREHRREYEGATGHYTHFESFPDRLHVPTSLTLAEIRVIMREHQIAETPKH